MTNQPTTKPTNRATNQQADKRLHRKVMLLIISHAKNYLHTKTKTFNTFRTFEGRLRTNKQTELKKQNDVLLQCVH